MPSRGKGFTSNTQMLSKFLCDFWSCQGSTSLPFHCLPQLALGRPRITQRLCLCVCECVFTQATLCTTTIGHPFQAIWSVIPTHSTFCAIWALADRPTASLFIYEIWIWIEMSIKLIFFPWQAYKQNIIFEMFSLYLV